MPFRLALPAVLALPLLAATPAAAQMPAVGIIDFYGRRTVPEADLRRALGVAVGDSQLPTQAELERRVGGVPGVAGSAVAAVCCEEGRTILYVGIEEEAGRAPLYRPAPGGSVRLPADILEAGDALDRAWEDAVRRGAAEEDRSRGHSLLADPAARAIQERFPAFAARDSARLRAVLHGSADARHRALAAQVLAYAADKRWVMPDLVEAMRDPDEGVRNSAMRALALIAGYGRTMPEAGIRVPAGPFIALVGSLAWTDRNKASLALLELTESRDPHLLAALRRDALPALADIARWKAPGHAFPALVVLGRIAGLAEDAIFAAFQRNEREAVIVAAEGTRAAR